MQKKICVIGGGRWGENHIRTLFQMGNLAGIVEVNPKRLNELIEKYPVRGFNQIEAAFHQNFDGYIIATPAETHYPLGKILLENGLSTLIEKPMALSSHHTAELIEIADKTKARLMVGHILLFHPAIKKIKEIIDSGKIGRLYYIYSTRLKLGTVRTDEDVFWSFAPHDVSVLDYLVGQPIINVEAKGVKFLQDKICDIVIAQFEYPGNIHAHIFVSWLNPFKEQKLVVIGSQGMLSVNDATLEKNIIYHQKHINWCNGRPVTAVEPDEIVPYRKLMPLEEELRYFVENLDKEIACSDGRTGHMVVKVLEKIDCQIYGT